MKKQSIFTDKTLILIILIFGSVIGAGLGIWLGLTNDLPQIRKLESFSPSGVTRIYSKDNVLLSELYVERRDRIPFDKIPEYLKTALVTTEDRNFYKHSGVDLKGMMRAIAKDLLAGKFVEGASTITQQLSKTLFLTRKKNLSRKLKEVILSFQLERRYTKDEILALYLNQVYFGSGAYGIKSCAKIFFNKKVGNLSLAQCALIAGMPKSPSRYSPLVNPELAIKRRNIVLKQMLITGAISKKDYQNAINEPLALAERGSKIKKAPYFVDYLVPKLEKIVGSSVLYKGGLTIFTTLDYELQEKAEQSIQKRMDELKLRMQRARLKDADPQAALISIDVKTGGILAMVGGIDYAESHYNRAVYALRQPGSAFKPFVYALAVEQGFSQSMKILDSPVIYSGVEKGRLWKPENFSKKYSGEISIRNALVHSKNIPAVRMVEMLGGASVARFAHKFGISSHLSPYLSLGLGASEVRLLELTAAYAVFPNRGKYIKPFGITEIQDEKGRIIWRPKALKKLVMSRAGAAIITDMLSGVIKEGTGRKALVLKRQLAGKTGTTNDYKDALFLGFSTSVTTGVWVGEDRQNSLGRGETGARAALPIWIDVMAKALNNYPLEYFDIPDNVVKVPVNSVSGCKTKASDPGVVFALFKKGTEPGPDCQ